MFCAPLLFGQMSLAGDCRSKIQCEILLLKFRRQEQILVFHGQALREKIVTELAFHIAFTSPFDAGGGAVLNGGGAAATNGSFTERRRSVFKLQIITLNLKGVDQFLHMLDGVAFGGLHFCLQCILLSAQGVVEGFEIVIHFFAPGYAILKNDLNESLCELDRGEYTRAKAVCEALRQENAKKNPKITK